MKQVFLPSIHGSGPVGLGSLCGMGVNELELYTFMEDHPDQRRVGMACHPILAAVAHARALDMGRRNYFGHTDPDGHGPNWWVRQAGFHLPDWYSQADDGNNVESIAGGQPTAAVAWDGWMHSVSHSNHVLGLIPFYAEQLLVGVGYAYVAGSTYEHYWSMISAPPEGT